MLNLQSVSLYFTEKLNVKSFEILYINKKGHKLSKQTIWQNMPVASWLSTNQKHTRTI
jgi:hypothetical protein